MVLLWQGSHVNRFRRLVVILLFLLECRGAFLLPYQLVRLVGLALVARATHAVGRRSAGQRWTRAHSARSQMGTKQTDSSGESVNQFTLRHLRVFDLPMFPHHRHPPLFLSHSLWDRCHNPFCCLGDASHCSGRAE